MQTATVPAHACAYGDADSGLPLWVHGVVFHVCDFRPPATARRATGGLSRRLRKYQVSSCGGFSRGGGGFFRTYAAPPARRFRKNWWSRSGSNRRPQRCERCALPTELRPHSAQRRRISISMGGRIMVSRPFAVKRSERVLKRFADTVCACTRIAASLGSAMRFARSTNHGKRHECSAESGR